MQSLLLNFSDEMNKIAVCTNVNEDQETLSYEARAR